MAWTKLKRHKDSYTKATMPPKSEQLLVWLPYGESGRFEAAEWDGKQWSVSGEEDHPSAPNDNYVTHWKRVKPPKGFH